MTHPIGPQAPQKDLAALLSVTRQRQIVLQVTEDGQLSYQAPAGSLTPDLRAQLATHRAALVTHLQRVETASEPPARQPPSGPASEPPPASATVPPARPAGDPPPGAPGTPPHRPADAAEAVRGAVVAARDWEDLDTALGAAQAAYEAGEVSRPAAEDLALLAARVSRHIPERVNGIKGEDLLPPEATEEEIDE